MVMWNRELDVMIFCDFGKQNIMVICIFNNQFSFLFKVIEILLLFLVIQFLVEYFFFDDLFSEFLLLK